MQAIRVFSSGSSSKFFTGGQKGNNAPESFNQITLGDQRIAIISHKFTCTHTQIFSKASWSRVMLWCSSIWMLQAGVRRPPWFRKFRKLNYSWLKMMLAKNLHRWHKVKVRLTDFKGCYSWSWNQDLFCIAFALFHHCISTAKVVGLKSETNTVVSQCA